MINYEEELKRFVPIPEVGDVETLVYNKDLTDMTDIMKAMIRDTGAEKSGTDSNR